MLRRTCFCQEEELMRDYLVSLMAQEDFLRPTPRPSTAFRTSKPGKSSPLSMCKR